MTAETPTTPCPLDPILDQLVVRQDAEGDAPASDIIIPDVAKERPQTATVLAIGEQLAHASRLRVGQRIVFGKYTGTEVMVGREVFLVLRQADVLAILR